MKGKGKKPKGPMKTLKRAEPANPFAMVSAKRKFPILGVKVKQSKKNVIKVRIFNCILLIIGTQDAAPHISDSHALSDDCFSRDTGPERGRGQAQEDPPCRIPQHGQE